MTRAEFGWRIVLAAVLTPVFHYAPMAFDVTVGWTLAAVVAVVLVFVGELLIDGFTGDA